MLLMELMSLLSDKQSQGEHPQRLNGLCKFEFKLNHLA
jgi:hypothetical protein